VNVDIEGDSIAGRLQQNIAGWSAEVRARTVKTAKLASEIIEQQGRADISQAGKFGARWTQGFTAQVTETKETVVITVRESQPFWQVFQYGKVIRGRPLLWIPLPGVSPEARGDFFQTSRRGNLLLFKKESGGGITPLRVAKESVTIPKKFHLVEIVREVSQRMGQLYKVTR
jgi:hypothetical protein